MTDYKIAALEAYLEVLNSMRKEYYIKASKARFRAEDTGSDSSYNTARRYEAYMEILKYAETEICRQIKERRIANGEL